MRRARYGESLRAAVVVLFAIMVVLGAIRFAQRLLEQPVIEVVTFEKGEMRRIHVRVANAGTIPLKIVAVFVDGTARSAEPDDLNLSPSEAGWISVAYPWKSGATLYVAVVTRRGKVAGGYFKAPLMCEV